MKKILCIFSVLLLVAAIPQAQPLRSISRLRSMQDYRPNGELRIYTYTSQAKDMGRLKSKVEEERDLDGRRAIAISETMSIDFAQLGIERKIAVDGILYVSPLGYFLGNDYSLGVGDQTEQLHLRVGEKDGTTAANGYYTRGGAQHDESMQIPADVFAWDQYLVDQLDLWLAMHDIAVGDTLRDSIFMPQSMLMTELAGTVDTFYYEEIYKNKFDSVFIITLSRPQSYVLHYTPDHRLVRTDLINQQMRVYLDYVGAPEAQEPTGPSYSFGAFVKLIPRYIVFLLAGLVVLLLLAHRGFRWLFSYIALLIGGVAYTVVTYGLLPLQAFVIARLPALAKGGWAAYLWWVLPSLIFGVGEEIIKAFAIFIVIKAVKPRASRFVTIGAFIGAGFGLIEAAYLAPAAAALPLFEWSLLEQIFLIVFHASAGALIGFGFSRGPDRALRMVAITIIVNTILRYMSVFALQHVFDIQIIHLINALITVVFLLGVIVAFRSADLSPSGGSN